MNSGVDGAATGVLGLLGIVLVVGLYVWVALALSAMFRKMGEEQWRAWVPFVNAATLLKWGGFSPWLVLFMLVPGLGTTAVGVLVLISVHRLNPGFGYGGGLTVLAVFLFPVWATILGFGPAQWRGARLGGAPIPPPRHPFGGSLPATGASPPYAPFTAAPPRPPAGGDAAGFGAPLPPPPYPGPGRSLASPPAGPVPSGAAPDRAGSGAPAGSVAPQPWAPPPPAMPPSARRNAPAAEAPLPAHGPVAETPGRSAAPAGVVRADGTSEAGASPSWPAAPTVARSTSPVPPPTPAAPDAAVVDAADAAPAASSPSGAPIAAVPGAADDVPAHRSDAVGAAVAAPTADAAPPTPTLREKFDESDMDEVSAISPAPFPPSSASASRPFVNPPVGPAEDGIISSVPGRSADRPVSRLRPPALGGDDHDPFPELTGEVSAVVGSPAAGAPMSASSSVSAQQREGGASPASATPEPAAPLDDLEDDLDQTVMVRRKRGLWELVPPSGAPIPLHADTVILGRHPAPDPAHPRAQLVTVVDPTRTVSKTHARLERRGDVWHIVDLGSTNGVLLPSLLGTDIELEAGTDAEVAERFLLGDAALRLQRIELPG
ncbi:DUF5684 domain-containing protein [Microbacterium sp. 179-B 1A2 NHS]|uniref:DUF5684 domain-containing protein n=1 Tax=Microbacterium sp. 179-B 1A2 NHS TaxID=3142383 RepID=UPI0039A16C72